GHVKPVLLTFFGCGVQTVNRRKGRPQSSLSFRQRLLSQSLETRESGTLLAPDLLLEKITEARAGRGFARTIALHGFGLFVNLLRLDRQRDGAALAIDVHEFRFDFVVDLEHGACILDTIAREL